MPGDLLSTFTPSNMSHEMLERIFVRRHRLMDRLVQAVADAATSEARPHQLLVGPRGMGKTHLISMLYWRTRKNPEIDPKVCIAWLSEDEYGAPSYQHLLLRLLEQIEKEYPDSGLRTRLPAIRTSTNRIADAEALLWETVGDRLLVIFAENLDQLFEQWKEAGQQCFRALLQNHRVLLIASTPQLFSDISKHSKPFYGFFNTHHLDELDIEEARDMLRAVAEWRGDTDMQAYLDTDTARRRLQVIQTLAGGHPRIWMLFAGFLTKEGLDELVQTFHERLDLLTSYFQERMQRLPAQQRLIVHALVDQEGARPVKDIAERCLLDERACSVQLRRLEEIGFTRSYPSGREKRYELREPLMRLALDLKESKGKPLFLIVNMLKCWYEVEKLDVWNKNIQAGWEKNYISSALDFAVNSNTEADAIENQVEALFEEKKWASCLELQNRVIDLRFPEELAWDFYLKCLILRKTSNEEFINFVKNIDAKSLKLKISDDICAKIILGLMKSLSNFGVFIDFNIQAHTTLEQNENSLRMISYIEFLLLHSYLIDTNESNRFDTEPYIHSIDALSKLEISKEFLYFLRMVLNWYKYIAYNEDSYIYEIPLEFRHLFTEGLKNTINKEISISFDIPV